MSSKLKILLHESKSRKSRKACEGYEGNLVFKTDTILTVVTEGNSTKEYETPCVGEFGSIDEAIVFASKKIGIRPDPSAWTVYDVDYTNYYVTLSYTGPVDNGSVSYSIDVGCYVYTPANKKDIDNALADCTAQKQ